MKKITKTITNYYNGDEKLINRTETIVEEDLIDNVQRFPIHIRPVFSTPAPTNVFEPTNVGKSTIDLQNIQNQYNVKPL